jgi:hypothetical protein
MANLPNPFAASVFPREEYFYRNKDRLLAPKLDNGEKFGTYGMIVIEVNWYYPILPGRLYHPVNNGDEAEFWLDFYKTGSIPQKADVRQAYFVPAPDQYESGVFTEPESLVPSDIINQPEKWYDYIHNANAYTTFPTVENTPDKFYANSD